MAGPVDHPALPRIRAALDELTRLVLAEETTQSVLQRVVDLVQQVMPPGTEASITVLRDERPSTAAFTGELALRLDETQYREGHGPCLEAALGGQPIEVTDARTETRWPDYMTTFLRQGALSALAVPVAAAQLAAALNVYARSAAAFTPENRQTVVQFADYAAIVLTNMDTVQDAVDQAANLRVAMDSRAVIEQAKGILMERYRVTSDQAFRLLTEASMRTNRKVRSLAEDLVRSGELTVVLPAPRPYPAAPTARTTTASDEPAHPPDRNSR